MLLALQAPAVSDVAPADARDRLHAGADFICDVGVGGPLLLIRAAEGLAEPQLDDLLLLLESEVAPGVLDARFPGYRLCDPFGFQVVGPAYLHVVTVGPGVQPEFFDEGPLTLQLFVLAKDHPLPSCSTIALK